MSNITATEREVVVLKAVWDWIDDLVNHQIFKLHLNAQGAQLIFPTAVHQRLFNVGLVDLLYHRSGWPFELTKVPKDALESEWNIFFHLRQVCKEPILNKDGSKILSTTLDEFVQWLETEPQIEKVWLPSIEKELNVRVKRVAFIKICGNIAKHSFMRLSANVEDIREILEKNGVQISTEEGYLVLPDFYDWFHNNIFNYHSSAIAEFLNNIRWALFDYLQPEFKRSYKRDEPPSLMYRYVFPDECKNRVIQSMYCDLMNSVRSRPNMPKFEVTRFLKMRY